jgi:transglutaminase/protease-like cytokinesis protein 3
MTKQEMFNRVWQHAQKKQKSSNNEADGCLLRATKEAHCPVRCFVGVLIPDDRYNLNMESDSLGPDVANAIGVDRRDATTVHFLTSLRSTHDNFPTNMWNYRLIILAEEFGLTVPGAP